MEVSMYNSNVFKLLSISLFLCPLFSSAMNQPNSDISTKSTSKKNGNQQSVVPLAPINQQRVNQNNNQKQVKQTNNQQQAKQNNNQKQVAQNNNQKNGAKKNVPQVNQNNQKVGSNKNVPQVNQNNNQKQPVNQNNNQKQVVQKLKENVKQVPQVYNKQVSNAQQKSSVQNIQKNSHVFKNEAVEKVQQKQQVIESQVSSNSKESQEQVCKVQNQTNQPNDIAETMLLTITNQSEQTVNAFIAPSFKEGSNNDYLALIQPYEDKKDVVLKTGFAVVISNELGTFTLEPDNVDQPVSLMLFHQIVGHENQDSIIQEIPYHRFNNIIMTVDSNGLVSLAQDDAAYALEKMNAIEQPINGTDVIINYEPVGILEPANEEIVEPKHEESSLIAEITPDQSVSIFNGQSGISSFFDTVAQQNDVVSQVPNDQQQQVSQLNNQEQEKKLTTILPNKTKNKKTSIKSIKKSGILQKLIASQPKNNVQMNSPLLLSTCTIREHLIRTAFEKNEPFGIYYRAQDGQIKQVQTSVRSKNGLQMMNNHLSNLDYTDCLKKNTADLLHHFPEAIEKQFGKSAYVFIETKDYNKIIDGNKGLRLFITMPGQMDTVEYKDGQWNIIKSASGVFEFTVKKNLYEKQGLCYHRFFNPKGTVGAQGFGTEFRAKEEKKLKRIKDSKK